MGILSIQSLVAYGHAGNSAAVFPMQRLGREVWPVMTVHFSHHTGYGAARGPLLAAHDVAEVVAGIEDLGVLGQCEAVLSGYQGAEDVGEVVLDSVRRVRRHRPDAVYCCDPVMGDVGRGMFVRPRIPELMRDRVVPAADVVTPNHFELDFLAGTTTRTVAEVLAAVDVVRRTGPGTVLVTSALTEDTPTDAIDMVVVGDDGAWRVRTPRLPVSPQGAGDLTAAVFLVNLLDGHRLPEALARTAASVHVVMAATAAAGTYEMQLVGSQDRWADPVVEVEAEPLR